MDIRNIIDRLGYSASRNLCSNPNEIEMNNYLYKLFIEIKPCAIYMADNKPFIAFCESTETQLSPNLIKKIWNAQIPLLIVSFDNRVEVYNGCSIDSNNNELISLKSLAEDDVDESAPFSFWNISNAAFWLDYEKALSVAPKLDVIMLDNIRGAASRLNEGSCAPFAVKIILRLIFIRYLIDRGVDLAYKNLTGDVSVSQSNLLSIMRDKTDLYDLFRYLKERFNGNLFELYEDANGSEIDLLEDTSLKILCDLMSGDLMLPSGQRSLFPLYDFNIIPVELISNIYERFLGERQKEDKAFYTPPHLVDYLLKQTITPFLRENHTCAILDPACGSGIFLVESARKLIEHAMARKENEGLSDQELIDTVTECLWGIDKNQEAIDIAIFSIYLTILDYKDPKTLKDFKLPFLLNKNFFVCDFFSEQAESDLKGKQFDFIIGNPPWGSTSGLHEKYCEDRDLPIQGKEISRSFVLRSKDFARENTCCCLIVTSKLFYNKKSPSVDFRKWLLTNTKVDKYIELAAVRELIFAKVRGPAGVVIYRFNNDRESNIINEMCHLSLKPNIFFKLFKIIVIEKNDYKHVHQSMLVEHDWAWKTLVFGYIDDYNLIKSLNKKCPTVSQIFERFSLKHGTGIHVADGKQDATHLMGRWLIDAKKGIHPFEALDECGESFTKKKIDRAKKDKMHLFDAPYTLIKKGFDTQTYKFRAAYSEADFLYTDAITGVCGRKDDKNILLALTGLFNSSLYAYLNLMLGSSSGIEREQGFPSEIFTYPAMIDDQIADLVSDTQSAKSNEREPFSGANESSDLIQRLDDLILEKFEARDAVFVDYALKIQIPLIAKNKMVWETVSSSQLCDYAQVFIKYFSGIFANENKYVNANIYNNIAHHYCAVEIVFHDTEPAETITEHDGSQNVIMDFMGELRIKEVNSLFYQMKDVAFFSQSSFYILKNNECRNWHPAMAKLDLADALDSILAGSDES
jgi:hypothetical protein